MEWFYYASSYGSGSRNRLKGFFGSSLIPFDQISSPDEFWN